MQEESEELKQVTKSSERQEQSLTQAKIDSLRQGQRLDAIDQKPKHDSSKTEVKLDAVMQEAEGKRGKIRSQKQSRHSPCKAFPSHKCNSPKMMHSQSPVRNKFFKNQTSLMSPPCSITSPKNSPPCWHRHTSSLNKSKAPPEAETPPEQMLCNECNAGGVSESIQGYKDMSNI